MIFWSWNKFSFQNLVKIETISASEIDGDDILESVGCKDSLKYMNLKWFSNAIRQRESVGKV